MATSPCCAICGAEDSWHHSLLHCTMARCVWALAQPELVEHMLATVEPDAKSWLFNMFTSVSAKELLRMTMTLWAIWAARRRLIHEGEHQSPLATHHFVNMYVEELEAIESMNVQPARQRAATSAPPRRWTPPPSGCAKINVDGAVCRMPPIGAVSAVCRDRHGTYLGSSAIVFHGLTDPKILETLACREALALGRDLHLQKIAIALDCLQTVQDIIAGTKGITAPIVKEIKDGVGDFQAISFSHEGRASNTEAHSLARHALHIGKGRHVWLLQPFDTYVIPINLSLDQ
ncbi:hypothetical protein ZWY2020_053819 [Hordeum vulgare]|nr:hypothetical protein ZWY2020_053819 [Hordeum vulgare]